jgi:hypothetical protein
MRVALLRILGFLVVFSGARAAIAQTEGAGDAASSAAVAGAEPESEEDALVREALERRRAGQHEQAVALLRRAYELRRSPRACGQLAFAEQAIGRWVRAEALLREALAATSDPWIERNRASLEGSLSAAARRLATVEIVGGDDGAELWVDGERAGTLPADRSLRVVVGTVRIEHRPAAPGSSTTRVVELAPGGRERVYFAPRESRPPAANGPANRAGISSTIPSVRSNSRRSIAEASARPAHALVWVGAATAAGAGAAVAIAWAVGNGIASQYDSACFGVANPDRSACGTRRIDDQRRLDELTVVTGVGWALLGVGVVGAGVGVGITFWGRGAAVQGRF